MELSEVLGVSASELPVCLSDVWSEGVPVLGMITGGCLSASHC